VNNVDLASKLADRSPWVDGYRDAVAGHNRGYKRGGWYNEGYKEGLRQVRARTGAKDAVLGYGHGYAGKPKAQTGSRYVEGYRLGARRRKAGLPPARFVLWDEQAEPQRVANG
jgi:hypothetical protein